MDIRRAKLEDIETIVNIWDEFLDEHDDIVLSSNPNLKELVSRREDARSRYKTFLLENMKSGKGVVFIAEADDQIAGFSLGFIKDEIPIFGIKELGYISDLYVKVGFRGKSISSKLKDAMISWFKSKGMKYVSVGFYADNQSAHDIYKKWGFFDYKIDARMKI